MKSEDKIKLVTPTADLSEEIEDFRRDFLTVGGSMDGCGPLRRFEKSADWLAWLEMMSSEETVPPGKVPTVQFIAVRERDGKMVGVLEIRRRFNDYLEKYAGHIGYSVRPSERRRGYGTQMLRLSLPVCAELGLCRVLVCCLTDNEGSRKIITACGGVYESTVHEPDRNIDLERYWIDTVI